MASRRDRLIRSAVKRRARKLGVPLRGAPSPPPAYLNEISRERKAASKDRPVRSRRNTHVGPPSRGKPRVFPGRKAVGRPGALGPPAHAKASPRARKRAIEVAERRAEPRKRTLADMLAKRTTDTSRARLLAKYAPEQRERTFQTAGEGKRRLSAEEAYGRRTTETSKQRALELYGLKTAPTMTPPATYAAPAKPKSQATATIGRPIGGPARPRHPLAAPYGKGHSFTTNKAAADFQRRRRKLAAGRGGPNRRLY